MKLALIVISIIALPFRALDAVELPYAFTGTIYYNGVPFKNSSIEYFEYPVIHSKKSLMTDDSGKYRCDFTAWGPCPASKYGRGANIQKTRLFNFMNRANGDSIVFYYQGSVFKVKNMADTIMYNYLLGEVPFQKQVFERNIYFTGK